MALAGYVHPEVGAVLEPLESHWLFGCPLLGEASVALLAEMLAGDLLREVKPLVALSGLTARSDLWNAVLRTFGDGYEIRLARPAILRSASLEGGVDGYLSRRSANHRKKLRQADRRAAGAGVSFERQVPASPAEADEVYDRMLAVEASSWKGMGECGMGEQPSRDLYRFLLRRLSASSTGRVIFARRDGRDVGFVFGGVRGTHYRGQQFSYDQELHRLSLGNLLQLEQIRWLCEEGMEWYDMGSVMDYKLHWAEVESRTETLLLRSLR